MRSRLEPRSPPPYAARSCPCRTSDPIGKPPSQYHCENIRSRYCTQPYAVPDNRDRGHERDEYRPSRTCHGLRTVSPRRAHTWWSSPPWRHPVRSGWSCRPEPVISASSSILPYNTEIPSRTLPPAITLGLSGISRGIDRPSVSLAHLVHARSGTGQDQVRLLAAVRGQRRADAADLDRRSPCSAAVKAVSSFRDQLRSRLSVQLVHAPGGRLVDAELIPRLGSRTITAHRLPGASAAGSSVADAGPWPALPGAFALAPPSSAWGARGYLALGACSALSRSRWPAYIMSSSLWMRPAIAACIYERPEP